ncbi:MAG: LysE family transporter [Ignavibacteriales bacterium]|nr:LysE family transporter [Ignavibacteriales bacterium]
MEYTLLLKGIIIGFALALPIGPIGILCIRKTAAEGHLSGMVVGFGAATADAVYGFIAAFGLTVISDALVTRQMWFRLIGGVFLIYLGLKTFLAKPVENARGTNGKGLLGSYVSTFFLTLTNPLSIIAFLGVFAGFGLRNYDLSIGSASTLIAGVFLGSSLWFFLLSYSITLFREKINATGLGWVNRISGLLIIMFGIIAIISFF